MSAHHFKVAARDMTIWCPNIAERDDRAAAIALEGILFGRVTDSTFMRGTTAQSAADRTKAYVDGDKESWVYGRLGSPNIFALQHALMAYQEDAAAVRVAATGVAATNAAIFSILRPGDEVVAALPMFGATWDFLKQLKDRWGVSVTFVDGRDPQDWERNKTDKTKLFVFETPTNPLLHQIDIRAVSDIAHSSKEKPVIVLTDSTIASVYTQPALSLGADIDVNSITKYLANGQSTGGAIYISREGAERLQILDPNWNVSDHNKFLPINNLIPAALAPEVAFHFLEQIAGQKARLGPKTEVRYDASTFITKEEVIGLRPIARASENFVRFSDTAGFLATQLSEPLGERGISVTYPGLLNQYSPSSEPKNLMTHASDGTPIGGGVFTVDFRSKERALQVVDDLARLYGANPETNLGQPGSSKQIAQIFATHQATVTYGAYTAEQRASAGIGDGLVRFSPGLGDPDVMLTAIEDVTGIRPLSPKARQAYIQDHSRA